MSLRTASAILLGVLLCATHGTVFGQVRFSKNLLKHDADWFHSDEARDIADAVLQYQSPQGGWPKSTDLAKPPRSPEDIPQPGGRRANSLDNDATTVPLRFLAKVAYETGEAKYRDAFLRGVDYLLAAQYPNGGWPQFWPLRKGYYSHITFNDGSMVRALEVLRDVAKGVAPYDFVDAEHRELAAESVARGIDCILNCQIRQNDRLTAWCAQHDAESLEPAWARAYEPPSLSGAESVGIVRFLMSIDDPSEEVSNAIEGAVSWLRSVQMKGWRDEKIRRGDRRRDRKLVADPDASPLWARFYELGSNRPLYLDRDSVFHYDYQEISSERRSGYSYHGNWANSLLKRDYPKWRAKRGGTGKHSIIDGGALDGERRRVIVSTDIGGTDPDDFQSLVHLLVYADVFDIEGLISSPFGPGRKAHLLEVIRCYETDYPNLKTYSDNYPKPDTLRAIAKQGETKRAPYAGVRRSTEGSEWITGCARRHDDRPLHVLIWGGIEDLAQALHDAPDILPKLRVYWIGGPNKKWSPDAYQYLVEHHPELWIIESNATYRGWFTGGMQSGNWSNQRFVAKYVRGKGSLGDFFASKKAEVKMGDTPSVARLLRGNVDIPTSPSWGGSYVTAWERPFLELDRLPTEADRIEAFGILELALPLGEFPTEAKANLIVENQRLAGHVAPDGTMRFRFSPKAPKSYKLGIESNISPLDGRKGVITAYLPPPEKAQHPSTKLPYWWTDDPAIAVSEGTHSGAKSVNRWREQFLTDFANRMARCQTPASSRAEH